MGQIWVRTKNHPGAEKLWGGFLLSVLAKKQCWLHSNCRNGGKRQLQQRSRQKGTATQERWLFPFSCKRKVTAKKDGEKTPREANPHWAP